MEDSSKKTLEEYIKARDEGLYTTPSKLNAAYTISNFGADLEDIEPFTNELTGIVDKMKEELVNEAKILAGSEVPTYEPLDQNELSGPKLTEEQWRNSLRNGSWTTDLTHTSTHDSNNSSSSVRNNSPVSDIPASVGCSCPSSTPSCPRIWGGCGCGTVATNESSECTVPTTSAPMPGTPSEEK
jgi:hypothetical protein